MSGLAITSFFHSISLSKYEISPAQKDKLLEIFQRTIKELAVALALTALACLFIPAGKVALLTMALQMVATNLGIQGIKLLFGYEKLPNRLTALKFSYFANNTLGTLFHESGHFLAYKLLATGKPQITLFPGKGGATTLTHFKGLTALGNKLGLSNANNIMHLSGPVFSLIFTLFNVAMGHLLKKSHPELSQYFNCLAIVNTVENALYALSALFPVSAAHDFAVLATLGFHPLVVVTAIVALPIIFKLALNRFN